MSQKKDSVEFLSMITSHRVDEAFETYVHPRFTHHNMRFAGDRASFLRAVKDGMENTKTEMVILRTLEDGELVAVHTKVRFNGGGNWIALVHLFRFQDGKIIEEWEVSNEVPNSTVNTNGAF